MAMNLSEQLTGDRSPWDLRDKRDFSGKIIPFGCLVYFWEDRKRPDSIAGKMSPSSSQGVFLGYHIQAGHVWRDEYLVAHLDGLDYRLADGSVKVIRTKRIELPDGDFVFPLTKDQQISVMDVDCDYEPSSDEGGPDDGALGGDEMTVVEMADWPTSHLFEKHPLRSTQLALRSNYQQRKVRSTKFWTCLRIWVKVMNHRHHHPNHLRRKKRRKIIPGLIYFMMIKLTLENARWETCP